MKEKAFIIRDITLHELSKIILPKIERILTQPFIIGITGASGAGKTTFSLALHKILEEALYPKKITVIQSDNFIYSNAYLIERDLMKRKGFPESFDIKEFKACLENLRKQQAFPLNMPCYSQVIKDIMPEKLIPIEKSDVYIIEGVNLFFKYKDFQAADYVNFSIYLDTESSLVKERALKRFFDAYEQSKKNPTPYFEQLSGWTEESVRQYAENLWETMDEKLLKVYIEPYRSIANLVLKSYT